MARIPSTLAPLRRPAYRIWAVADVLSGTGSWMQTVALNWLVYTVTGSTTALGLTLTVSCLPGMLFGLWGGAVADRLDARRVLPWTQSAAAVFAALLAVLTATGQVRAWHVWLLAVVCGLVRTVEGPCLGRFGAQLLGPRDLAAGVALGSAIDSTARILGMALAGVVVAAAGPAAAFALNAVSFLGVVLALRLIRRSPLHDLARSTAVRGETLAGLRYLLGHRELMTMFGLALVLGTFGRNFQVTMAAMANGQLHAGAAGYGAFSSAFAAGALLGALLAAKLRASSLRILLTAGAGAAVLQVLSGAAPTPAVFMAVLVPIAGCAVVLDSATAARVHLTTEGRLRGRALAAQGLVGSAAGAVGGPLLGWACDRVGARATLASGGLIALAGCAAAVLVYARLRRQSPPAMVRRHRPAPAWVGVPAEHQAVRAAG